MWASTVHTATGFKRHHRAKVNIFHFPHFCDNSVNSHYHITPTAQGVVDNTPFFLHYIKDSQKVITCHNAG